MPPRAPVLAALVAAACTPASPRDSVDVTLTALGLGLRAPLATTVEHGPDGATLTTAPGARVSPRITLHRGPGVPGTTRQSLRDGLVVSYTLRRDEGGSAGPVERLEGTLELGDCRLAVTCDDQGEPPDATWCLPFLATLHPVPATTR